MARLISLSILVLLSVAGASLPATAIDLPVEGGRGGGPFRIKCEPGSFVAGFEGRTGAYIDNFRILCASFDPATRRLRPPVPLQITIGLSQGGGPASSVCPAGWGVSQISFQNTWREQRWDDDFVYHINFKCQSIAGTESVRQTYGPAKKLENPPGFLGHMIATVRDQTCPPGELAVGFAGKSGLYVDALGMICEPIPAAPPPPPLVISPNYHPNTTITTNKPSLGKQAIVGPSPPPLAAPPPGLPGNPSPQSDGGGKLATNAPKPLTSFTGTWDTRTDKNWTYVITFDQDGKSVSGKYVAQDGSKGKISGKVKDGVLEFKWEQDGGFKGTGQFSLSSDGRTFSGIYTTEPNKKITDSRYLQGSWSGTRR